MSAAMVALGELMATRVPSLDPAKFPDEEFELWSIPAFDAGAPECTAGRQIGSAKKIVRPNDVLISRIVPHIRRAWIVDAPKENRRQIASGEWIVFRSDRIHPAYLRHVLVGDAFHNQFMETVSGMGGSLLRARPEAVKLIKVPLPPLPEQRRIAAILDQADALRRLRRDAFLRLGDLGQAIFEDRYGHLEGEVSIENAVSDTLIGLVRNGGSFGPDFAFPYVRMDAITTDGAFLPEKVQRTDASDAELARYALETGDILFNTRNSKELVGKTTVYRGTGPCTFNNNIMRIRMKPDWDPVFVEAFLRSRTGRRELEKRKSGTTSVWAVYWSQLKTLKIPKPSRDEQASFRAIVEAIWKKADLLREDLEKVERLFASLQHRAFRGEL